MSTSLKVPPFPESVEEGTLTTWHKKEGDAVERDEKIADIETDKIVLEVSAPAAGKLTGVKVESGDIVKPGELLALIEEGEGSAEAPAPAEEVSKVEDTDAPPSEDSKKDDAPSSPVDKTGGEPLMSPAVRRLVEEHEIDPHALRGTGRKGMITKADVQAHLDAADWEGPDEKESEETRSEPPTRTESSMTDSSEDRPEKRVPMTRIRARIAERLVQAQQAAAILTTFNEVNMQPVMDLRARYKDAFEKSTGAKLGFMSFFVKASVEALKKFPVVNASLDGSDIIYHGFYDIGVAVSTDRGLVVPVLRDADQLSYAEIERTIVDFAGRAREGKLGMDDLTGGTFTITNGGIFGSMLSTPILNPPQCAILGMHKIQERPMVEDGQVVIRPMMYLALSYDHRLIDGREAVQFLVAVKENLEDPARTLLQI